MKKLIIAVPILFVFSMLAFSQEKFDETKISKETDKIVRNIKNKNVVMGDAVGYAGERPLQYDNFIKLKSISSKDELTELTSHPNPTVRCYAFWALSYDNTADLLPIVLKHIQDKETVSTQFGCSGGREKVGDFFISVVTPEHIDLKVKKLTQTQLAKLDEILLSKPNDLNARDNAISRVEPTEEMYLIIRSLFIKEKNQTALITLAKYKKEEDIDLILNNREKSEFENGGFIHTYKAIINFPHIKFLPLLENNLKKTLDDTHFSNEWASLYKAIANYKDNNALRLLQIPFTQVKHKDIRKYHLNFIYDAINEFNDSIYDGLFWKFWVEENILNLDIFKYLLSKNPAKAFNLTKEYLKNPDTIEAQYLVSDMLNLVLSQEKDFALEIIIKNIKEANVHLFPIFAAKVIEIKNKLFIEPLLQRFEQESNPHIFLKIASALISYKDEKTNQRILEITDKNKNLKSGWGGEDLDKLLKENNLKH